MSRSRFRRAAENPTTRPLRVAFVSDAVHPWHTGGKEARYHEVMTRLAAAGVEIETCTMRWWEGEPPVGPTSYRALCPKMALYTKERRSIIQGLGFALGCLRLLNVRADVIEADHMPYLQLFPLKLVSAIRRIPLVVTWNEYWGREYWVEYLGPAGRLAAALERLATRLPDRIVAISKATGQRLLEAGVPGARITVLPSGVLLHPVQVHEAGDLVVAGRLIAHKRADLALETLRVLHDRGRDLSMVVIGDGPERGALEEQATRLDLGSRVQFLGTLESQEEVWGHIASASVLVAPSEREGFGMAVAESMSIGTPVVVADHPDNAARDLVTDGVTGRLAAPGDAAAFADAVESLLGAQRSQVASRFAEAHPELSWDTTARGYLDLYLSLRRRSSR